MLGWNWLSRIFIDHWSDGVWAGVFWVASCEVLLALAIFVVAFRRGRWDNLVMAALATNLALLLAIAGILIPSMGGASTWGRATSGDDTRAVTQLALEAAWVPLLLGFIYRIIGGRSPNGIVNWIGRIHVATAWGLIVLGMFFIRSMHDPLDLFPARTYHHGHNAMIAVAGCLLLTLTLVAVAVPLSFGRPRKS